MKEARKPRPPLHLARAEDALEVRRLPNEADEHFAKRCASITRLGVLWLAHPQYRFDPRHSNNPEVWRPAHMLWWARVHVDAMTARDGNPAFIRAQAVRRATVEG